MNVVFGRVNLLYYTAIDDLFDVNQRSIILLIHRPLHSSSYQAEKSAMVRAISWLDEYEDWQSALVLCDSKSLVETLANSNQPDGDVHRI